jgi:hypothetical protein
VVKTAIQKRNLKRFGVGISGAAISRGRGRAVAVTGVTLAREMSIAKFDGEGRVQEYFTGAGLRVEGLFSIIDVGKVQAIYFDIGSHKP